MDVAEKYGMIMPDESSTEASCAVFLIDDKQIIRAIIYYPLSTGRNMDELVRLAKSLQTADEHGVATLADWQEGDRVIVPPARTREGSEERMKDDSLECVDFYFCTKEL